MDINKMTDDELRQIYETQSNQLKALRVAMKQRQQVKHKMPETERKTKSVGFRVTQDTYNELQQLTDVLHGFKSPHDIAKTIVLEWIEKDRDFEPKPVFNKDEFELMMKLSVEVSELKNEVSAIGRNFNQYVRQLNKLARKNLLTHEDVERVQAFKDDLKALLKTSNKITNEVVEQWQQHKLARQETSTKH